MKRAGDISDLIKESMGKKKKKREGVEDIEVLEVDVEPVEGEEKEEVLEEVVEMDEEAEQERLESGRALMEIMARVMNSEEEPSDDDVEEFTMELENILSYLV